MEDSPSKEIPPSAISPFLGQPDSPVTSDSPTSTHPSAVFLASTSSVSSVARLNTVSTTTTISPVSSVTTHVAKRLRVFKIIVIGDSGVGKTCLTFRFCGGEFRPDAEVTIGVDFRERVLAVEGENIKIQLWDTAGQERFRRSMVQHYYRNTHAVLFVYDVTKVSTFESLTEWIQECNRYSLGPDVPRILVGNKCDCKDQQAVHTHAAQRFADSHNMLLFETSAKDDSEANHVEAIFMTLALKLKRQRPFLPPMSPSSEDAKVVSLHSSEKSTAVEGGCSC